MQKGIVFDQEPERVSDLGTGCSNVHLNIQEVTVEETDEEGNSTETVKYQADVVRVNNPATEENILKQVKEQVYAAISAFDSSPAVNQLTVQGHKLWIPRELRLALKSRLEAEKKAGITTTTLWQDDVRFVLETASAEGMLHQLELFASAAFDVTAQHRANVAALTDVCEVVNYDYTTGYPAKLNF